MRTIGLLGGMSWESTAAYCQMLHTAVGEMLGEIHSARCIVYSMNSYELEQCLKQGNWDRCASLFIDGAKRLERSGADYFLMCTNTMHHVAPQVAGAVSIPFIHIADGVAKALPETGIGRVGLLGTRYTMEEEFDSEYLQSKGVEVVLPDESDRRELNRIIFDELRHGIGEDASREFVLDVADKLGKSGAEGIVLGCSKISLILDQEDIRLPLFDAMRLHAAYAAELSVRMEEECAS